MATPWTQLANDVRDLAGWAAAGLASSILLYTKTRKTVASDDKATSGDMAITAVIDLLKAEVNRLALQNAALARIVSDLQLEVIAVRDENAELKTALNKLTGWNHGKQNSKAAD